MQWVEPISVSWLHISQAGHQLQYIQITEALQLKPIHSRLWGHTNYTNYSEGVWGGGRGSDHTPTILSVLTEFEMYVY